MYHLCSIRLHVYCFKGACFCTKIL